jgi:hypothetical protein
VAFTGARSGSVQRAQSGDEQPLVRIRHTISSPRSFSYQPLAGWFMEPQRSGQRLASRPSNG